MNINLSPRLLAAASLVRGGGIVADIGTDHAYLPVYLVQQGKAAGAIAADIGKQPLDNALKSVEHYGLTDKIELRLSDGLKSFSPGEVEEIVIAGMGGTLIAAILSAAPWVKDSKYHFVFQPQSRAEELRAYLFDNGFEILHEIAVAEGRRYYITFDAVYTGVQVEYKPADCFLGKLPSTPEAREHIKRQVTRLSKKCNALSDADSSKALLVHVLEELRDFIND